MGCKYKLMAKNLYLCSQIDYFLSNKDMDNNFTWIPLYQELAKALLQYKDNRAPLVQWIYDDLGQVTGSDERSLVAYLKQKEGTKIIDIDPFSVMGIFNRNVSWEKRTELLTRFKNKFGLTATIPTDFNGIPTLDSRRSFFFSWGDDNEKVIRDQWKLFESVVEGGDIADAFDKVLENGMSKYSLTMCLFWICPERFLALDSKNRAYLSNYGLPKEYSTFNYQEYSKLLSQVQEKMDNGIIPCSSFTELSFRAWKTPTSSSRVWMWNGGEETFSTNILKAGSSAKGLVDFESHSSKESLGDAYRDAVKNADVKIPNAYWDFISKVKPDDIVVVFATRKESGSKYHLLYGWGRFTSECIFKKEEENPIQRTVEWHLPHLKEPVVEKKTKNDLFFHLVEGAKADNIIKLLNIAPKDNHEEFPEKNVKPTEKYPNEKFLEEVFINEEDFEILKSLLLRKKNLILQGAPGVGKTFAAKRLAYAIMGEKDDKRIEQIQFHQNYSYEDFMMGYKPNEKGGFDMRTGVFYNFCQRAKDEPNKPYFFIIDEINRGNLSKIFGELLMLIESDYRDTPIKLSYSDEEFAVPSNLHIIGMMNTADRSLAMIDYALRRRFSFFEMKPGFDSTGFKNNLKKIGSPQLEKVVNAVVELNNTISTDTSLGYGFCIGHSYFCNIEKSNDQLLKNIVEYDIIPMLREYWFDNDDIFNTESQKLRDALK